ncbi:serine hydrolase domain-containing protein [Agromyces sp. MMS24-K17]|uniref:serine hydrolase domain-containing protein n=1 Tax=Agromyces sp. MMS24-K17 TaxID=3372850 RepID=UPI003754DFB8
MRILRRILLVLAAVVLVAIVGVVAVYWWQRPLLLTGTGYAAHNACAVTEVAGRDDPETDLPPNPLVPYLRVDGAGDPTNGTLLGVLARQQAWYAEGFGCTLAGERPDLGEATAIEAGANPYADAPAPAADPAIDGAIALAFGDDLDQAGAEALGTRGIVVLRNGALVGERYAEGFDQATPQLGWSMSKSVASLMVGVLAQQGAVSLEEDHLVADWTDGRAGITVDQLLRMTSGLQWDETYDLGTPITRMLYLEPDMGAYVASQPLAHEPGTVQQYSSGSTTLLCSVLAERTGLGADLPRQTLLGPLGLTTAVWEPDASGTPVCSSYLWASPRDWAAIGQFALQGGAWNGEQLLPPEWMQRSLTVEPTDATDDPGYGLGWRVNTQPDGSLRWPTLPADAFSANGHDGQEMIVVPSEGVVVVRLGFTPEVDQEPTVIGVVQAAIAG